MHNKNRNFMYLFRLCTPATFRRRDDQKQPVIIASDDDGNNSAAGAGSGMDTEKLGGICRQASKLPGPSPAGRLPPPLWVCCRYGVGG